MSTSMQSLDETVATVAKALEEHSPPAPEALVLSATGVGELRDGLQGGVEIALGEVNGTPEQWQQVVLHAGRLGATSVWLLEDHAGEPSSDHTAPPWVRGFPTWLAASAGASICVHTSAGSALPGGEAKEGDIALVRDHLNLSGTTPLLALGSSKLGPLFPDLSRLHHVGLRQAASKAAQTLGIACQEAVVACTMGPALETAAERRLYASFGADLSVPSLAPPYLAAGHAGLALLGLVAVVESGDEAVDVARILERASTLQPSLENLISALDDDLKNAANKLRADEEGR